MVKANPIEKYENNGTFFVEDDRMNKDKIVINISEDIKLSDAIYKALNPKKIECKENNLYQTIKVSQSEDKLSANCGLDHSVDGHSSVI